MTNRKIKDFHKNKLAYDILLDNLKMLSIILLCLNEHFPKLFYQLNVQKWLEDHKEWCEMMNDYEANDAYDFKMKEFCDECGIDDEITMRIVEKHLNKYHPKNMTVLQENVKLALIHTAVDFCFGKIRLGRLTDALLNEDFPNWVDDIAKFGIIVDDEVRDINYRKLKPKKQKAPTVQEQKESAKMLAEYRAYFEYVTKEEGESCLSE